ncbi:basic amino acid/polyamine antiporter [Desulfovibrio litoralis]|uniref:Arginine:ornithine antiporter / lysine permease n=1 Tax=Desulfovibrio litoralis DSM 11393 TaxID=1121455 RepID=A0A1M7S9S2_9BACT|nr:basic amino acid/polyamine antiporter [Desulfovibrio litoralis]SHN55246.1 arginine:ornithine antiporter / lysine permease [Desulfovibrio litoralis DSM 11393]
MSSENTQKLSLYALIALVMGSMIGSGIFALPSIFARNTGVFGALIAWSIAGFGMLMLAFVFQNLSNRRPDLDSGIYAYAEAGFGSYLGFCAAMGYWIGCCFADVACLVLIKATLGMFFPIFGDGTTIASLIGASFILWGFHFLVLRGIKEAAMLNTIATAAKIIPIFVFIFVVIMNFNSEMFSLNFWGGEDTSFSSVLQQVRNTMLVTVFVFVGIEGASVYSRYAKNRKDVGVATVLGFLGVLCLLFLVTVPVYGVLKQHVLAGLPTPSMSAIFEIIVGRWGSVFISVGLLISILGNYLSWCLLAAEVLFSAAKDKTMPAFLAKENKNKVPVAALWISNILIQIFLVLTPFADYAFSLALSMTSSMTLFPYLLVGAYGLKLAITGETYEGGDKKRKGDLIKAALATLYASGMIISGGAYYVMLSSVLYLLGSSLFFIARKEQNKTLFTKPEAALFACISLFAVFSVYSLTTTTSQEPDLYNKEYHLYEEEAAKIYGDETLIDKKLEEQHQLLDKIRQEAEQFESTPQ